MYRIFSAIKQSITIFVLFIFVLVNAIPVGVVSANLSEYNSVHNFSSDINIKGELEKEYCIRGEQDTIYGKVYLLSKKQGSCVIQTRASFWDVTDIAMAGISWAKFFGDASWENFGWAILDTASLLPLIPSLSYVRNSDEAIRLIVHSYLQGGRYRQGVMNAFTYQIGKFRFNRSAAMHMYEKSRYIPVGFIEQAIKVGKQVPDKRMHGYIAYYVNNLYINGKRYNFKVVYNPTLNIVQHFHFQREALDGILPAIKNN